MYYLKLKDANPVQWCWYSHIEEIPTGGWYMECVKLLKYACEFETHQDALNEKVEWDESDAFEIIGWEDNE